MQSVPRAPRGVPSKYFSRDDNKSVLQEPIEGKAIKTGSVQSP